MIPNIAAMLHGYVAAGALDDNHGFNAPGFFRRHIDIGFKRNFAAAAQALISSDDHRRLTTLNASSQ